jgi:hypothetical protein
LFPPGQVLYVDMADVFITIGEMDIRTDQTSDSSLWNQNPSNAASNTGGTRSSNGCAISSGVTDSSDYGSYLDNFVSWVASLSDARSYGVWQVFTDCFPPSGTVGLAYLGTICWDWGYNTGWNSLMDEATWLTFAHELGHNFGE